jgi:hypothetical protein
LFPYIFNSIVASVFYTHMRSDLFVRVTSLLDTSCLPLTIPYPQHAENECNSSKVSAAAAAARSNSKSTDSWVGIARGRHHQRHLAVGVHSLIKPIKPSHFRAAVSNPVSEGFEKCHKLKKRGVEGVKGDGSCRGREKGQNGLPYTSVHSFTWLILTPLLTLCPVQCLRLLYYSFRCCGI